MKHYWKTIILLIYINCSSFIFSQNKIQFKIDSLKKISVNSTDLEKTSTYYQLFNLYRGINLDSAEFFAKKSHFFALKSKNQKSIGYSWLNLGNMQFDRAMNTESLNSFKNSIKIANKMKDSVLLSRVYKDLGGLYSHIGNFNLSIKYILKALPIFEKLNNRIDVANTYLELGTNLHRSKKFNEALLYNKKALVIYKKEKNKISEGITYNNNSNSLNGLQKYSEAISEAKKAITIFNKHGYSRYTAYPKGNMAISYDSLKKYNLSKKLYLESIKIHNKNNDHYELAFLKNSLANLFLKNKKTNEAINVANESLKSAKKIKALEFETFASKTLATAYNKIKEYKKSAYYFNQYSILKDSLFKIDERKSQLELKEQYESSKKEKEIILQKEQLLEKELAIKNRNLYAILLGAALILLTIISLGYYKRNQLKRKQLEKEIELKDALSTIKTQNRLQEQRLRISRDLHDNIGSQLTFIISSIDNLKYVSKDANEKLKNKLSNISSFTSDTIFQLRDTIWAMNKNTISFDDIHARVLSYIEKAKLAKPEMKFITKFKVDNLLSLTSIQGMNLFRVIQEATNNAIKHAEASTILISVSQEKNKIKVNIKDDGKGFDITKVTLGNGLSNIEKRIGEIDGQVFINSKPNQGTDIQINCNL